MKKLRLKRHGSFSIREGWFEKAINAVNENEKSVFGKTNGIAILGVGSNMVASIRYWLNTAGIIDSNSRLTSFGNLLIQYDPYLDEKFSWWMIHNNIVSNFANAPVFHLAFNTFDVKSFNKEMLNQFVFTFMKENEFDMSNKASVDADTTVLLRTYLDEKVDSPEDNLNSPLGKLGLLGKGNDGLYSFKHPSYKELDYLAVYYSLLNCLNGEDNANIDDLMNEENSPARIFMLDKNLFYLYLNDMSKNGLVIVNRTAGLNQLYIQRTMTIEEIFASYFERRA